MHKAVMIGGKSKTFATLVGGLGNQLFQAAAAYAYAKTYGKELILDFSDWTVSHGSPGKSPKTYKNSIFQKFDYIEFATKGYTDIFESRFNFDFLPYYAGDVKLHGYFQSLKYFETFKEEFISQLVLPDVDSDFIEEKNVAFHIRRTDYLIQRHIHFICDTEYFKKQFEAFDGYQINVFTDDPEAVSTEFNDYKFNIIQGANELSDLQLLSQHDNIVASNSSFSWWASLLGKPKQNIIVPDIWFKNFENHDDIYRSNFTRVPV